MISYSNLSRAGLRRIAGRSCRHIPTGCVFDVRSIGGEEQAQPREGSATPERRVIISCLEISTISRQTVGSRAMVVCLSRRKLRVSRCPSSLMTSSLAGLEKAFAGRCSYLGLSCGNRLTEAV
jgi:hypothetical protein